MLIDRYFQSFDTLIYILVAICLIITALFTLYSVGLSIIHFFEDADIRHAIVNVIDKIMLALMIIEIMYTVRISLQSHQLQPEPFILVGMIAAIRRILVISVESGYLVLADQEGFLNLLLEIAVLGVLVILFVVAIVLLRREKIRSSGDVVAQHHGETAGEAATS